MVAGPEEPRLDRADGRTHDLCDLRIGQILDVAQHQNFAGLLRQRVDGLEEFKRHRAMFLGISVDGVWCHRAYIAARNLHFPLLADLEPKGAVSRAYGAYRAGDGFSERALFVIDADGIIRWSYVSPVSVNPGADGVLAALENLSTSTATAGATS
jgi:alkyl hydroperoxide reductase subunit AhpC